MIIKRNEKQQMRITAELFEQIITFREILVEDKKCMVVECFWFVRKWFRFLKGQDKFPKIMCFLLNIRINEHVS